MERTTRDKGPIKVPLQWLGTTWLGDLLHEFQKKVCLFYQTFNLPSEEAAQAWRKAAILKKDGVVGNATDKKKG